MVENAFARGRSRQARSTMHRDSVDKARMMMSSEQVKAFDVGLEPAEQVPLFNGRIPCRLLRYAP